MGYSIWLEFEEYRPPVLTDEDGYCNVIITHDDGKTQGFNVWTIEFYKDQLPRLMDEVENQGYARLPDLIVSRLDREHITAVMHSMFGY
jgi:hypothetical protein